MRGLTISAHGGLDQLEYRTDLPKPEPKRGELRVRVKAVGLNHLDLFVLAGIPNVKIVPPWVLGADAAGVADAIGDLSDAKSDIKVGDIVIINPGLSDHTCEFCQAGEHSLCVKFGILGDFGTGVRRPSTEGRRQREVAACRVAAVLGLGGATTVGGRGRA